MKLDAMTLGVAPAEVPDAVRERERQGYDAWFTGETNHDPFLACALAAASTERIEIGTAIAVAFPRSPMHVAHTGHDLQLLSGGRFVLGLGSQVRAHVTKRFSATWSEPAARMREYVLALHAIWRAWNDGEPLAFRGEHYRHTLMTPFFTPPENPHGPPPVYVAAVGPRMTEVAGEVADGVLCHSFTTARYLREETLPAVARGAEAAGRDPREVAINLGVFVATGRDEEERAAVTRGVKQQIAFYGSTPAYRRVLDLHGWGDLHEELNRRARRGEWGAMADAVDPEVLDAFAIVADPDEVADAIRERFGGIVDRVSLYTDFSYDDAGLRRLQDALRGA